MSGDVEAKTGPSAVSRIRLGMSRKSALSRSSGLSKNCGFPVEGFCYLAGRNREKQWKGSDLLPVTHERNKRACGFTPAGNAAAMEMFLQNHPGGACGKKHAGLRWKVWVDPSELDAKTRMDLGLSAGANKALVES